MKELPQPKKMVLPRAHGPGPSFTIPCYRAPRGGGARSGIPPCYLLFRPLQPIFVILSITRRNYVLHLVIHPPSPVHLSAWTSCYLTQCVYSCIPTSVWSLARSHLLSSRPFPYRDPYNPSIARSPSSRFRVSGQLIQVQAQSILWRITYSLVEIPIILRSPGLRRVAFASPDS
jgi:hypothetical protein